MKPKERAYAVLVGLALAALLAIELRTDLFWHWLSIPYLGGVTLLLLLLVGALVRLPGRWLARTTLGCVAVLALIAYLPLNPTERFASAVGRLQVGMSEPEVEAVMAGQVKGAFLAGIDGVSIIPPQPYADKTYYEPQLQTHSFDTCCLVSWQHGRVSDIEIYFD